MTYQRIDLSHTIEEGMITYKGLPAPIMCDFWSRESSKAFYDDPDTSFQIGKIEMVANTGTYLDTPFHRYADGKDLAELPLEKVAYVKAILISIPETCTLIDRSFFENKDLTGKAVLIHTNWSKHWRTDAYFEEHPYLSADAADYLVAQKVVLVGIDSYNIDRSASRARPVHTILLGAEIPIVEHLCCLDQIPANKDFYFSAVPPKIKHFGSFPVRAYALVNG